MYEKRSLSKKDTGKRKTPSTSGKMSSPPSRWTIYVVHYKSFLPILSRYYITARRAIERSSVRMMPPYDCSYGRCLLHYLFRLLSLIWNVGSSPVNRVFETISRVPLGRKSTNFEIEKFSNLAGKCSISPGIREIREWKQVQFTLGEMY